MLFESPPMTTGTDAQKLSQVYSYLYQLSEQLNATLNNLTIENFSTEVAQRIEQAASSEEQKKAQAEQANTLKALIIKTANVVRAEMDLLETTLHSEYLAISDDFGTYKEEAEGRFTATANGLEMVNTRTEQVSSDLDTYKTQMAGSIRMGYFPLNGTLVYGIAIAQDLTTQEVNGKEVFAQNGLMTTFTSGRISFWEGTVELAYITGGVLHIPRAELSDSLMVGNYVIKRLQDNSFGIMINRLEVD